VSSENLVDVVVEVDVAGTQMASEHRRVRREDRSDVDVTRPTDDQSHAGDPLVEVCHQVRRRASHLLLILHTHTHTHTTLLHPVTQPRGAGGHAPAKLGSQENSWLRR